MLQAKDVPCPSHPPPQPANSPTVQPKKQSRVLHSPGLVASEQELHQGFAPASPLCGWERRCRCLRGAAWSLG